MSEEKTKKISAGHPCLDILERIMKDKWKENKNE